jgi:Leucine-rich repeat (LRR) protein
LKLVFEKLENSKITSLNLAYNNISYINDLPRLENLKDLYLRGTEIKSFI